MNLMKICSFIDKIVYKSRRLVWLFFHPYLWGKNIQINGIPKIQVPYKLKLGKYVSINENVFLQAKGGISIGDNVTLSYGTTILTEGLSIIEYSNNCKKKYRDHECKSVEIGNGTWIGANVIILPGAKIPNGCVIAAGAVVSGTLKKDNCLYAGVPSRLIKELS